MLYQKEDFSVDFDCDLDVPLNESVSSSSILFRLGGALCNTNKGVVLFLPFVEHNECPFLSRTPIEFETEDDTLLPNKGE